MKSRRLNTSMTGIFLLFVLMLWGCAKPGNVFILQQDPDGDVGKIVVANLGGEQIVREADHGVQVADSTTSPTQPKKFSKTYINRTFGITREARPEPPQRYLLYFQLGSVELTRESAAQLTAIVTEVLARTPCAISLHGHMDSTDRTGYDLWLSKNRAMRVKKLLMDEGVAPACIDVVDFGATAPLFPVRDGQSDFRNNRVEIFIH